MPLPANLRTGHVFDAAAYSTQVAGQEHKHKNMFSRGIAPQAKRQVKARAKRVPGQMNKTERAYADELETRKLLGEVLGYWYEPFNIRVANDKCWLKIDFLVVLANGELELIDVKGDGPAEDDAIVKMKVVAAHYWPFHVRIAIGTKPPKSKTYTFTHRELTSDEPSSQPALPTSDGTETDDVQTAALGGETRIGSALGRNHDHEGQGPRQADAARNRRPRRRADSPRIDRHDDGSRANGASGSAAGKHVSPASTSQAQQTEREGHCEAK